MGVGVNFIWVTKVFWEVLPVGIIRYRLCYIIWDNKICFNLGIVLYL